MMLLSVGLIIIAAAFGFTAVFNDRHRSLLFFAFGLFFAAAFFISGGGQLLMLALWILGGGDHP